VHGGEDKIVPVEQARRLHGKLKEAGVSERLEVINGAGHGWQSDDRELVRRLTLEFFDRYLRK
ncbi:MAG: prolyl oligopeptidase family serine peptidase, partial [Planctomycetota bacterium]|nr:prolyl oligopeptidase family serine peptidase [Planctomycetota bacterium]